MPEPDRRTTAPDRRTATGDPVERFAVPSRWVRSNLQTLIVLFLVCVGLSVMLAYDPNAQLPTLDTLTAHMALTLSVFLLVGFILPLVFIAMVVATIGTEVEVTPEEIRVGSRWREPQAIAWADVTSVRCHRLRQCVVVRGKGGERLAVPYPVADFETLLARLGDLSPVPAATADDPIVFRASAVDRMTHAIGPAVLLLGVVAGVTYGWYMSAGVLAFVLVLVLLVRPEEVTGVDIDVDGVRLHPKGERWAREDIKAVALRYREHKGMGLVDLELVTHELERIDALPTFVDPFTLYAAFRARWPLGSEGFLQ